MPGPRRSPRRPGALARLSFTCAAAAAGLGVFPASAETRPVDLRDFRPPLEPGSGLFLEPATSPETFSPVLALWGLAELAPLSLGEARPGAPGEDVPPARLSADLVAGFGIAERALVGFDLPVVLPVGGAPGPGAAAALGGVPGAGLGDFALAAKATLLPLPTERRTGFALALFERLTFPTGEPMTFASEGGVTGETRLLGELRLSGVSVRASAGVKLRAREGRFACEGLPEDSVDPGEGFPCARFGHELPFALGLARSSSESGLRPFVELAGKLPLAPASPFEDGRAAALRAALGASLRLGVVSLLASLDASLGPGVPSAPLRLALSVAYAPPPGEQDADGDGLPARADACPDLAEDRDGFEDRDGCPERDNDADGVPDALDACPSSAEDGAASRPFDGCAGSPPRR